MKRLLSRPFLKILRLARDVSCYPSFTKEERENLTTVLTNDLDGINPQLKLMIYELMLELRCRIKRNFGMLVVLGWQRTWDKQYAAVADDTQDIFRGKHFDLRKHSLRGAREALEKTVDFDGAILVDREGIVVASGAYLDNVHPKKVAQIIHPGRTKDLSSAFGFSKKVHTRHLAAIAASYVLKDTTVFVVSEEDRSLRIFENGRIIWSTNKIEIKEIVKENK